MLQRNARRCCALIQHPKSCCPVAPLLQGKLSRACAAPPPPHTHTPHTHPPTGAAWGQHCWPAWARARAVAVARAWAWPPAAEAALREGSRGGNSSSRGGGLHSAGSSAAWFAQQGGCTTATGWQRKQRQRRRQQQATYAKAWAMALAAFCQLLQMPCSSTARRGKVVGPAD